MGSFKILSQGNVITQQVPGMKSIIMSGRSFLVNSDLYLVRTYEFMDETPQITEKQLVMTMDKVKDTKVSNSLFSADISKSEDISRWQPINKAIHCNFSATKTFFGNPHICLQEN